MIDSSPKYIMIFSVTAVALRFYLLETTIESDFDGCYTALLILRINRVFPRVWLLVQQIYFIRHQNELGLLDDFKSWETPRRRPPCPECAGFGSWDNRNLFCASGVLSSVATTKLVWNICEWLNSGWGIPDAWWFWLFGFAGTFDFDEYIKNMGSAVTSFNFFWTFFIVYICLGFLYPVWLGATGAVSKTIRAPHTRQLEVDINTR
jgi:hypothetical protein